MRWALRGIVLIIAVIAADALSGGRGPAVPSPAAADGEVPPGWVLAGYQNTYYTYYETEQVGTQTVTYYLYMEPYQDRVVYTQETRLSAITWYSQPTSSYGKYLTYRSSCWLNPYYPWDMQCAWTTQYVVDQYYTGAQQYWYTTVNVPQVVTDYRAVYGSVQVPVYQQVQRTGVCSVPIYQFVGGSGAVTVNSDGTFTMWVPQASCVYSPYTRTWTEVVPQVVYGGQACRSKLNASLSSSTGTEPVYVYTSSTWSVATSWVYQCQTIYVPTWAWQGTVDCSYHAGSCPQVGYAVSYSYYSPDGLVRYDRYEYHPACHECFVTCTEQVYRLVNQPQTDCRYMPYDYLQQSVSGYWTTNTRYSYSEQRWYTQQCWDTYALSTTSTTRSERVDRYVANTSWQQMTLQMPALPDAQIGVNPGTVGLTGLRSWFWVENVGAPETTGPNGVRVRLVPSYYEWDFNGDGYTDLVTSSPGRRYPLFESDVGYTYERSSLGQPGQKYNVGLTVHYNLQINVGQGWQTVGEITQQRVRPYPVQQLQSVVGQ